MKIDINEIHKGYGMNGKLQEVEIIDVFGRVHNFIDNGNGGLQKKVDIEVRKVKFVVDGFESKTLEFEPGNENPVLISETRRSGEASSKEFIPSCH